MDKVCELLAWLECSGRRDVQAYAERLRQKLARNFEKAEMWAATSRSVSIDQDTSELVVIDTIETRVSGATITAASNGDHKSQKRRDRECALLPRAARGARSWSRRRRGAP